MEKREADHECYLCLVQRGRIAIGALERIWYTVSDYGRPGYHAKVYTSAAFGIFEYRYHTGLLDPFLFKGRKLIETKLREQAGGGAFENISAVHFPFRKPVIIDYQLSWMRERRRRR